MAIKIAGTEVINDNKRVLNNESLPDVRPSLLLDFANSKTLDPRITFTRVSTATYWDGKTTAKAEENLLKYSQDFDNSSWATTNVSVTDDTTTAPDGTTTAALVQASATTSDHYFQRTALYSPVSGQTYTLSCYLKAGTIDDVQFVFGNAGDFGSNAYINVDLTAGTITHTASSISASSITDIGNGWYRVTMSAPAIGSNGQGNFITSFVNPSSPTTRLPSFTAAGTETYYLWGAQVEQRSSATAYTATTTSPIVKYQPVLQTAASGEARFDHDPVTGESKGLLIEEARTNLHPNSNGPWSTPTGGTYSYDYIVSPVGNIDGVLFQATTGTGIHVVPQSINFTSGTTYTGSFFIKKGTDRYVYLSAGNTATWAAGARFDLDTGSVLAATHGSATIKDVGNGWYRCAITGVAGATATTNFNVWLIDQSTYNTNFTAAGTETVYLFGAQLEVGSFPTSYIPTSGSTVTRAVELVDCTGTNFSQWFNPTEGTILTNFEYTYNESGTGYPRIWSITEDGNIQQRMAVLINESANGLTQELYAFNSGQVSIAYQLSGLTGSVTATSSFAYEENNFGVSANGSLGTDTSGTVAASPPRAKLRLGGLTSGVGDHRQAWIKKWAYYPQRLPNATLQAMTEA